MANRNYWTVIIENDNPKICRGALDFTWESGISISQRTKSCKNMHAALYYNYGIKALDISSASYEKLGKDLSAFNLKWNGRSIECWYQGSKVYQNAGAQHQLYNGWSLDAKRSAASNKYDRLVGFELITLDGEALQFPLEPRTVFYDWIYLQGIMQSYGKDLDLSMYDAFTDIQATTDIDACQARSVCIYSAIKKCNQWEVLESFDKFVQWHKMCVEFSCTNKPIKRNGMYVISDDGKQFYSKMPSSICEDIITSWGFKFKSVYPGIWNIYKIEKPDEGKTCVVYTDLLLDDMCALEYLSRYYDNVILSVDSWGNLPTSDYAPAGFNIFQAVHSIRLWFKNVIVATTSITLAGIDIAGYNFDAYVLCSATNIMKGDYVHYNNIWVMGGMDSNGDMDNQEWNAKQDMESFNLLKSLPNVHLMTHDICDKLYKDYEKKLKTDSLGLSYYNDYVNRMNRIGESVSCYDLQVVRYALDCLNS